MIAPISILGAAAMAPMALPILSKAVPLIAKVSPNFAHGLRNLGASLNAQGFDFANSPYRSLMSMMKPGGMDRFGKALQNFSGRMALDKALAKPLPGADAGADSSKGWCMHFAPSKTPGGFTITVSPPGTSGHGDCAGVPGLEADGHGEEALNLAALAPALSMSRDPKEK